MSCLRARRKLLWLVRFGELGQDSAPHLDHLAGCRACRDEVGLDRALVRQLRTALAERVADAAPSPAVWDGILARTRQPEPRALGLRGLALRLAGALRVGTATAGAGLALVLALNLEIVPMAPAPSPSDGGVERPAWAGDVPPFVDVAPAAPSPEPGNRTEARDDVVVLRPAAEAEQLPLGRSAVAEAQQPADAPDLAPSEPAPAEDDGWEGLVIRLVPADAARITGADTELDADADRPAPVPDPPAQGPS